MRCALELQMTAAIRAEEIRKAKEEKEKRERMALHANTIAECERIGVALENEADMGRKPFYQFCVNQWSAVLKETRRDYADHRLSYNPTSLKIDIDLMRQWFKQYCFDVKVKEFFFYEYGCGSNRGYVVYIEPSADCLK